MSTRFTSVLAATDLGTAGNNAVRRAALVARAHGARLHIVHVLRSAAWRPRRGWFPAPSRSGLDTAQARAALDRLAAEIAFAHGIGASVEVALGDPLAVLQQAAEHADLIVLGWSGRGRFRSALIGSTAARLLAGGCGVPSRPRALLTVKTPVSGPYRRALVPVDFTAASDAALWAADAMARDAALHVFHAIAAPREAVLHAAHVPERLVRAARLRQEAGACARMRRRAARIGLDPTRMAFSADHGPAVRATLHQARTLGVDLIVAGKREPTIVDSFAQGSVSRGVLSLCGCDMLIVPRPGGQTAERPAPLTVAPPLQVEVVAARTGTPLAPARSIA